MRILHYNLGLPPYRSGGLTGWSLDLIQKQVLEGHDVSLLYPSDIRTISSKIIIKATTTKNPFAVFRLINPLPVPLVYAIDSEDKYLNYDKDMNFSRFFSKNQFETIHLHSLMGLPLEFIKQAKEYGVKVVYTAHDIFGIWPEPELLNSDTSFIKGYIGNQEKLSYRSIVIIQSTLYRTLKHTAAVRLMVRLRRKFHKKPSRSSMDESEINLELNNRELYKSLRVHYSSFFELIDEIHFNSQLTRDIFKKYGINRPCKIIPVFHSFIPNRPVTATSTPVSENNESKLQLLYNGPLEAYKGYDTLISSLDELQRDGIDNFELNVHSSAAPSRSYVRNRGSYTMSMLRGVYSGMDVTIVPSLCYETFGMVVAESLGFCVPVIVSKNVGAKSLLNKGNYGHEFQSTKELTDYLKDIILKPEIVRTQKQAIINSRNLIFDTSKIYSQIIELYRRSA